MNHSNTYERFSELLDKLLEGEELSGPERAEYDALLAADPKLRVEADVLLEMGQLEAPATPESRRLADAALKAFQAQQAAAPAKVRPRSRLRARRKPLLVAGSVFAACAAALLVYRGTETQPEAPLATRHEPAVDADAPPPTTIGLTRVELTYRSGAVEVVDANGKAPEGDGHARLLQEGQTIRVADGSACFVLDPGIDICLDANSRLHIAQVAGAERRFELERGRVGLQLDHQPRGFSVTVVAGGVESTAVGTAFSVALESDSAVHTTVMEGRVRVENDAKREFVSAHHRLSLRGKRAEQVTLTRAEESEEWAVVDPARLWQDHRAAVLTVEGGQAGAQVMLDGQLIGVTPLTTLVTAGTRQLELRRAGRPLWSNTVELSAGQEQRVRYEEEADVAPALEPRSHRSGPPRHRPAGKEPESVSARGMLSQARQLVASRQFEEAAKAYEAVRAEFPGSPEARAVLVALAQLELEHRHTPTGAEKWIKAYLSNGPGPLTQEAEYLHLRVLKAQARPEEERAAIATHLQAYPDSFHHAALKRRLAQLDAASQATQGP